MGETIRLKSRFDGFEFDAYRAPPGDARRGGLLLIQEIFGVTEHIRELCDGYAEDGYEVIAPAFYDRLERGFACDYSEASIQRGVQMSQATPWDQVAGDAQAALDALGGPRFVTGYCWGGAATWLAACRCEGIDAAACFYGRRISELVDETPRCPTILHFGKTDASIPLEKVDEIREKHPELPIYLYEAGHGFVSDRRRDYHEDSARLARLRTLALFSRHSGVRSEA
ncbi:MAG: dienelactone hydrolase family protein [Phenylobacterium sp.]|uniref:dienelactone hydrolase family protein n=1 Tax=Phenylobacterium sp. TaxID=1871053 RepID=UPI001A36EE64|nr:dienelactone hydrolase family protein [Phenylobacterium sp.]MBL8773162.1 dienelactone hydrolase family protein [Phenylobacterium sp.]